MTTARAFTPPSDEDIYENLDDNQDGVPSCRRITVPAIKRAKLLSMQRNLHELHRDIADHKTEPPAQPPAYRAVSPETAVPEQSVRRLKVAKVQSWRVSGTPESIEETVSEAQLRDPRREE